MDLSTYSYDNNCNRSVCIFISAMLGWSAIVIFNKNFNNNFRSLGHGKRYASYKEISSRAPDWLKARPSNTSI